MEETVGRPSDEAHGSIRRVPSDRAEVASQDRPLRRRRRTRRTRSLSENGRTTTTSSLPATDSSSKSLRRWLKTSTHASDDRKNPRYSHSTAANAPHSSEETPHSRFRTDNSPSRSRTPEITEEIAGFSFDEPQIRTRGAPSHAAEFDSEKVFRRRGGNRGYSKSDSEGSLPTSHGTRNSAESFRPWIKMKSSSENGSEDSPRPGDSHLIPAPDNTPNTSEGSPFSSFWRWRMASNNTHFRGITDSDFEQSLYLLETEKSLQSDGEGTGSRSRSHQAKIPKTMWDENVIRHVSLYRAALMGEWEVAEMIFNQDSGAITAKITLLEETALHIIVGTGGNLGFVEKLVNLMSERSLPLTQMDLYGNTALAVAAIVGNVKAAEILVKRNQTLPSIKNNVNYSPLHLAAKYGHKDMILYLLSVTNDEELFTGKAGARLLTLLIAFDIYDVALAIISRQPELAVEEDQYGVTALEMLAQKPDVFESRTHLGFWQRLLYRCVTVKLLDVPLPMRHGDVENPSKISKNEDSTSALHQLLTSIPLAAFRRLVPNLKNVYDAKRTHMHACEMVRRVCEEALNVGGKKCAKVLSTSLLSAARMGTLEVATEILRVYPYSIWFRDFRQCNIFQLAVLHRQEKIYNLIYQMTSHKHFAAAFLDRFDNNILHLAGELAPSDKISGAALQMQRELQWFKEVEKSVQPSYRTMKNKDGRTPRMVFSEEHESLVHRGEKWMKTTASSCTVVAALVATVAFAAVFTAPGGNSNDKGVPILVHRGSFMVFAAADATALITSSVSVMMFLGILTSRYSEDDFLESLPTKLIIGLVSLFISISSMVAAFSASLYLVLAHQVKWAAAPIVVFAFVPVVLFAVLQFPLLLQIVSSTYGKSIFGSQSKEIIH